MKNILKLISYEELQDASKEQNSYIESLGKKYIKGSTTTGRGSRIDYISKIDNSGYTEYEKSELLRLSKKLSLCNILYREELSKYKNEKVKWERI